MATARILFYLLVWTSAITTGYRVRTHRSQPPNPPQNRRPRLTQMSVVQYWREETNNSDPLDLAWSPHVNSWNQLKEEIKNDNLREGLIIEGDVYLNRQSTMIPVMQLPPDQEDSVTFKDWLLEVSHTKKAIRINIKTSEAMKPVLQYLFAFARNFYGPIIISADIERGIAALKDPIDPRAFFREAARSCPDATLNVGWTQSNIAELLTLPHYSIRYSWRAMFDMMEHIYEVHQPVMLSVEAPFASHSYPQLSWFLGIRDSLSLLIWSRDYDTEEGTILSDWTGIAALGKISSPNKILYNLKENHKIMLEQCSRNMGNTIDDTPWNADLWRVIQFINPSSILSTIIKSRRAPAFLGWPTAFLLSEKQAQESWKKQSVSGRVLFVPKANLDSVNPVQETGLSIYLLESIEDIGSPMVGRDSGAIHVFIGFEGNVFIQSRIKLKRARYSKRRTIRGKSKSRKSRDDSTKRNSRGRRRLSSIPNPAFFPRAISQMVKHDCYGFSLVDSSANIELNIYASRCSGSLKGPPKNSWHRKISLPVQPSREGKQRHVIIQKSGDGTVDMVVEHLYHSNGVALSPKSRLKSIFMVPFLFMFKNITNLS